MTEHNLAALRAKATNRPWRVFKTTDGRKYIGVGAESGDGILDAGFGVWSWNDAEGIANAELIVALVNAYDRGELVPAQSVEAAKTALKNTFKKEARGGKVLVSVPAMELAVDRAFDAILHAQAALREGATTAHGAVDREAIALAALQNVRKLISEAAMTGFNYKDGDWADRLFFSQQETSRAIALLNGGRHAK